MAETKSKRRRWLSIAFAVVLALVAVAIAWQFLPLNAAERALVGTWQLDGSLTDASWGTKAAAPVITLQLDANRRFLETTTFTIRPAPVTTSGTWTAAETSIHFRVDNVTDITPLAWPTRARLAIKTFFRSPQTLRFDGPDSFWIGNHRYTRIAP